VARSWLTRCKRPVPAASAVTHERRWMDCSGRSSPARRFRIPESARTPERPPYALSGRLDLCRLGILFHRFREPIAARGEFEELISDRLDVEAAGERSQNRRLLTKRCNPFHCPLPRWPRINCIVVQQQRLGSTAAYERSVGSHCCVRVFAPYQKHTAVSPAIISQATMKAIAAGRIAKVPIGVASSKPHMDKPVGH